MAPLRDALLAWYRKGSRPLPWRTLWHKHHDPYHIWVSEIMLQQTVIKAVIPVYARFLERFPTLAELAAADEEKVKLAVRGLGYYRRFRFLHTAAKQLISRGTGWPQSFADWKQLPGIGDYTAAAVSSIAFAVPAAVVDGNVERVFCRLLDRREAPNQPHLKPAFQQLADELLDRSAPGDFNQAVMELGQTICTPAAPTCSLCPISSGCLAYRHGSQALAPGAKIRAAKPQAVAMQLTIYTHRHQVALLPRPSGARFLSGTWGFFTTVQNPEGGDASAAPPGLPDGWEGEAPAALVKMAGPCIGAVRHSITHHRIMATVCHVELSSRQRAALPPPTKWVDAAAVETQLVANLDRKAWQRLRIFQLDQGATPLFS